MKRVAILFSRLSGYMAACFQALRERHGVELLVVRYPQAKDAPFEVEQFGWIDQQFDRSRLDLPALQEAIDQFNPDAVLMAGWVDADYLRLARVLRRRGVPIVAGSDAQWSGTLRQQVARLVAPWYLHTAIDVLWVAGERQRRFARRLGFVGEQCWDGYYAGDWSRFAGIYNPERPRRRAFLFVGRYIARKGVDLLVSAYRRYRAEVAEPWTLVCAGTGAQQELLTGVPGIEDRGFVQPEELPALFREASAFVLPSRKEPWGVAVHEAAAAGLPLICSDACGAAVHLLQDGLNGRLFASGNIDQLTRALVDVTAHDDMKWTAMSAHSHRLSKQYTPERWADTFCYGVKTLRTTRDADKSVGDATT